MDVDSLGKKCKERMVTELSLSNIEEPVLKKNFHSIEFDNEKEFSCFLDSVNLSELKLIFCIE